MIKEWFFNKLKTTKPSGTIEVPPKTNVNTTPRIHHLTRSFVDYTSNAISRLDKLTDLFSAPRVIYIEGVHTRVIMCPINGLGSIVIIFDSESGDPLCAELKECE